MAEMDWPSDALVICTRNRIDDIKRCLASVEAVSYVPQRILVVDSSDGRETEEYCAQFKLSITYIRAPRGLIIQRNVALTEVHEQIIHFIDDDVEVHPDYFLEILRAFRDSPEVAGVGGAMVGVGFRPMATVGSDRPRLSERLALKSSSRLGRVLRSGHNMQCFDSPKAINVDWLPGCTMSFRMSAIRGLKFDERRTLRCPMHDDVDFGLRVSERGPLLHTPNARLIHHLSPANRDDYPASIRASVVNRWMLAVDFPHRVSRVLVIYSSIADGLMIGVRVMAASLLKRNAPASVKRERAVRRRAAFAAFAGVVDVLRDGPNVEM